MFNSGVLDVAIGLAFVYLVVSTLCSHMVEWFASYLGLRAQTLEDALRKMLDNPKPPPPAGAPNPPSYFEDFFGHNLIEALIEPGKNKSTRPSYIPSRTFALTLLNIVVPNTTAPAGAVDANKSLRFGEILTTINSLPSGNMKESLLALLKDADGDLDAARKKIEQWFDDVMDRASGWYKRQIKSILLVISFVVVISFNIDSLQIADSLWKNPKVAGAVADYAQKYVEQQPNPTPTPAGNAVPAPTSAAPTKPTRPSTGEAAPPGGAAPVVEAGPSPTPTPAPARLPDPTQVKKSLEDLKTLQNFTLPLGWPIDWSDKTRDPRVPHHRLKDSPQKAPKSEITLRDRLKYVGDWVLKAVGWAVTMLCVSFGSPFWFELLNQFVNIRKSGQKPEKTSDSGKS